MRAAVGREARSAAEVTVRLRRVGAVTRPSGSIHLPQSEGSPQVWWTQSRRHSGICWEGVASLRVRAGRSIEIDTVDIPSRLAAEVLNPALALVLAQRGFQILHAGAVAAGAGCAAIMGPPGSGKSSLVLAAARRGLDVVSDEIVPMREERGSFRCPGGNPVIRLDSGGSSRRAARAKREVDVRRLGLGFTDGPRRIRALVFLAHRLRPSDGRACHLEEISQRQAVLGLLANTYNKRVLSEEERRHHLNACARAAGAIPAYSLSVRQGVSNVRSAARAVEGLLSTSSRISRR